jgi:hypothetical protein
MGHLGLFRTSRTEMDFSNIQIGPKPQESYICIAAHARSPRARVSSKMSTFGYDDSSAAALPEMKVDDQNKEQAC